MKKQILLSAVLACISVFSAAAQKEPVDYVNPFVGTTNYGTTNPGALTPVSYTHLDVYKRQVLSLTRIILPRKDCRVSLSIMQRSS